MSNYTELKNNAANNTLPDKYIKEALAFVNYFQEDHNGVLSNDYAAMINDHYATANQLTNQFHQINVSLKFKPQVQSNLYKIVLTGTTDPLNIETVTKDDINNIQVIPVNNTDKKLIFSIIDDMVEEYLDETDSVHL